jgi:hypothetical protein
MSTILVDNLTGKTSAGSITVTSEGGAATQSLQQGLAKVWACFVQDTSHTFHDSFNCSSLTDGGAGFSSTAYTNVFNNDDYSSTGMAGKASNRLFMDSVGDAGKASTGQQLYVSNASGTGTDGDDCNVTCHGDLA